MYTCCLRHTDESANDGSPTISTEATDDESFTPSGDEMIDGAGGEGEGEGEGEEEGGEMDSEEEDDDLHQLIETLQNFVRDSSKQLPSLLSFPPLLLSFSETPPPRSPSHHITPSSDLEIVSPLTHESWVDSGWSKSGAPYAPGLGSLGAVYVTSGVLYNVQRMKGQGLKTP